MAEESLQERTEEATPKKRADARREGRVPRSVELTTAVMMLGSAIVLLAAGSGVGSALHTLFGRTLYVSGAGPLDADAAVRLLRSVVRDGVATIALPLTAISLTALLVASAQARGVLSVKPLGPNWGRLNPVTNLKRMLGVQPWAELVKSLLKLTIVGAAVFVSLRAAWPDLVVLAQQAPSAFPEVVRRYTVRLLLTSAAFYIVLAIGDYLFQIWQHERQLRMTRHEVKQEHKQTEGDPLIKQRLRSMGRALARRQMFREVPSASVVITNPTHIAVALRYDPSRHDAPVVVAMGQRLIAERIKELARRHDVPMVENRPLARALLRTARVGTPIPPELYVAVAEVLAWVLRNRGRPAAWSGGVQ